MAGPRLIAGSDRSESAYNNLATSGFEQKYTLGIGYTMAGDGVRAQVVDTSREGFGGSVFFLRREFKNLSANPDTALGSFTRLEQVGGAGLSVRLGDGITASATGKYRYIRPYDSGLAPTSFWTVDLGVAAKLSPLWMLSIAAKDLLAHEQGLNYRSFEVAIIGRPMQGLEVIGQADFMRAPEGSLDTGFASTENSPSMKFGVEYDVSAEIAMFGQYASLKNWNQTYTNLGLGYRKDNYDLSYAFRFATNDSSAQYHIFALSIDM